MEITGYLFKTFYADKLYWQPRIWDINGTVQPFVLNMDPLPYDVRKFKIYVSEKEGFRCNFEALETAWGGTAKDITKVAVDKDDPYFASLLAACIISHVGGISRKHLVGSEGIPKVVVSIARYYVYYHMKRFLEDSRKMDSYKTGAMKELVKANLQTKTLWKRKFVRTRENISLWYQQHPNRRKIRNYRYVMTKNNTGVLGDRIRRGGPRDQQERRRLDDSHQGGQRRSHQDGAKTFPTRRGVLRLVRIGCAGTDQVAHHRTGSKEFANPRHFPQARKRHRYPR